MGLHQIQKLLHCKRNNQQSKDTAYRIGESLCQIVIRGLISRIYKELQKTNHPNNKWEMELNRHLSNEELKMANK
jgi:hypothetical protein